MPRTIDQEYLEKLCSSTGIRADMPVQSFNEETYELDVIYTTGARVRRMDWTGEVYYEELSTNPGAVRLERLKNNAPVLNSHKQYNLSDQIGVIIDADETKARIRLSRRDEIKGIVQDIKDGIIRNVSVGYKSHRYIDVTTESDDAPVFRAVDWEPMEISFVCVPADHGAQSRSESSVVLPKINECKNENKERTDDMPQNIDTPEVKKVEIEERNEPISAEKIVKAEQERSEEILSLSEKHSIPLSQARSMIREGLSIDQVRSKILDELASRSESQDVRSGTYLVADSVDKAREAQLGALLHRADPENKLENGAQDFRNLSLLDFAKRSIRESGASERDVNALNNLQIVKRALNSTSDFPLLLSAVTNKVLRKAYDVTPRTFTAFCQRNDIKDLKPQNNLQLGGFGTLPKVLEGGEYTSASIGESNEISKLEKYGKKIILTEEIIINDDLNAFARLLRQIGTAIATTEANIVYAILLGNPNMSDSVALFHATHANAATTAFGVDGISKVSELLMNQKDIDGETPLNIEPRFVIVPPSLRGVALQLQNNMLAPGQVSSVNPYINTFTPIVESRLQTGFSYNGVTYTGDSTDWFAAASPNQIDTIEYGYLQGTEGPVIEERKGFDVDGLEYKVKLYFAAKALDWRGLAKCTVAGA